MFEVIKKVAKDLGYQVKWDKELILIKDIQQMSIRDPEFYKMIEKLDMIDYFTGMNTLEDYLIKYFKVVLS